MKKAIISAGLAYLASCVVSMAVVQINWNSQGQDIYAADGSFAPVDYFAQLIWTPDQLASPLDMVNPFVPTEGEIVLASQSPLNSAGVDGAILSPANIQWGDEAAGGYVYTRVFDSATTPRLYGQGDSSGNSILGGGLTVQTLDPATVTGNGHNPGVIMVDQIVPEPSVIALFGLGALAISLRRRRS